MSTEVRGSPKFAIMKIRYGLWLIAGSILTMAISCGHENAEESSKIIVKKGSRTRKKGRIFEKVKVVQVPLTAEENNLRGKVHTMQYVTYTYNVQGDRSLNDSGTNAYDTAGRLVRQDAWDRKGQKKWACAYEYDKTGKLSRWTLDMIQQGKKDTTTFVYNTEGDKVRTLTRANDPKLSGRKEYTYDGHGNEAEVTEYDLTNKVRGITRAKYNDLGDQVLLGQLFPNGTLYTARAAEYDVYGGLVSLSQYVGDSITGKTRMVNDSKGKHVEVSNYSGDGIYYGKSVYRYDTSGNMLEHTSYGPDDSLSGKHLVFEYEYDSTGNITKATTYRIVQEKRLLLNAAENRYTYYRN